MFGTYAMQNFKNLIASQNLAGAMGNSFLYAIVQTVISMFVCSLAGFGFELYHDKNKDRLFSILLLAMMVPQVATMVGVHPAQHFHSLPDHDVPTELPQLPQRPDAGSAH